MPEAQATSLPLKCSPDTPKLACFRAQIQKLRSSDEWGPLAVRRWGSLRGCSFPGVPSIPAAPCLPLPATASRFSLVPSRWGHRFVSVSRAQQVSPRVRRPEDLWPPGTEGEEAGGWERVPRTLGCAGSRRRRGRGGLLRGCLQLRVLRESPRDDWSPVYTDPQGRKRCFTHCFLPRGPPPPVTHLPPHPFPNTSYDLVCVFAELR